MNIQTFAKKLREAQAANSKDFRISVAEATALLAVWSAQQDQLNRLENKLDTIIKNFDSFSQALENTQQPFADGGTF